MGVMNRSKLTYDMIQAMKHCIGFNESSKTYVRKGIRYYDAYRNYYYGSEKLMDEIVNLGYANKSGQYYSLNQKGFDVLFYVLSVRIKGEIACLNTKRR